MGHLEWKTNHLARTTGGHLARCDATIPVDICKCLDGGSEVTRPDVTVTVGGSMTPLACNLCSGSPTTPASCGTYMIGDWTASCNGTGGMIATGNHPYPSSIYVCAATLGNSYYYWTRVFIEFSIGGAPYYDRVLVYIRSGFYLWNGSNPTVFNRLMEFVDIYGFESRANCSAPVFDSRVWVDGESETNNCCDITNITTSVANV